MVLRSASRKTSRSPSESSSRARKVSIDSATETRTTDFRSRLVNSRIFCCMRAPRPPLSLVQRALLRGARGLRRRAGRSRPGGLLVGLARDQPAELAVRLLDVALVLEDHVQGVLHEI